LFDKIKRKFFEKRSKYMEFFGILLALCLFGMTVCLAAIILKKQKLSRKKEVIGVIISTLISTSSTVVILYYYNKWSKAYYGFEAPITIFAIMAGVPFIIGEIVSFFKKMNK